MPKLEIKKNKYYPQLPDYVWFGSMVGPVAHQIEKKFQ
jgi:hypothetical protein